MLQHQPPYSPLLIAHRGGAFHAPENTLTAFRTAAAMGAQWIETDVCLLADGTPILFHDRDFSRICDIDADVRLTTWDQAKTYSIKDHSCNCVPESIPTLQAGLKLLDDLGLSLNLEIKLHNEERQDLIDTVLPVLMHTWPRKTDLLVTSFDIEILQMVRNAHTDLPLGLICERIPEGWQSLASQLNLTCFTLDYKYLTRELVQTVTAAGQYLYAYTPNQAELVSHMWDWGLSGIISDNLNAFTDLIAP